MRKPGRLQGGAERRPPGGVARVLLLGVGVVVERGGHRPLLRAGHHQPEVLAYGEQLADHGGVAGDEGAAVAREVGALGQRVHREDARRASRRRSRGGAPRPRSALPGALEVALVADQQRPRARGTSPRPCAGGRAAAPARSGWTGSSARAARGSGARREVSESVATASAPASARPDLVGRVGDCGVGDQVAGADPEVGRHRGDQLLGADHREHAVEPEAGDAVAARQPVDRTPAGSRTRPIVLRVAGESAASRSACCTTSGVGSTGVPIERSTTPSGWARAFSAYGVSRSQGKSGSAVRRRPRGQSWGCGGSASISGWSLSISPILAAPPGEPRSSKKWTLAS